VIDDVKDARPFRTCARTTATSLDLGEAVPVDEWIRIGRQISRLSCASCWWLGDWLLYGQRRYRDRYRSAMEQSGLDYQTLRNYAWVADAVAVSRRRQTLSFGHHADLAALYEADQEIWLARAERHNWTRAALRRELRAWRTNGSRSSAEQDVVLRLHLPEQREQRWRAAASAAQQPLLDWIAATVDEAADAALKSIAAGPVAAVRAARSGGAVLERKAQRMGRAGRTRINPDPQEATAGSQRRKASRGGAAH
jgi:hypothetical protein